MPLKRSFVVQFFLYFLLGLMSLGIDLGLFLFLTEMTHLAPIVNATFSCIAAILFNYFCSYLFIFAPSDRTIVSQVSRFLFIVLLATLFHDVCFWIANGYFAISPFMSKLILIPPGVIWNFWTRRSFVFSKKLPKITQKLFGSSDA